MFTDGRTPGTSLYRANLSVRDKNCMATIYHIYSAIRRVFSLLKMITGTITKSVLRNFVIIQILPFLNNPKDLDPSCKMDLDFWDCFGRNELCLKVADSNFFLRILC